MRLRVQGSNFEDRELLPGSRRRAVICLLAVTALLLASCKAWRPRRPTSAPIGVVLEFIDEAPALSPDEVSRLKALEVSSLFVPARVLAPTITGVTAKRVPLPAIPYSLPVTLVFSGRESFEGAFREDRAPVAADALAREVANVATSAGRYGRVEGLHLELRVPPASYSGYAKALRRLRRRLPPGWRLSVAFYDAANPDQKKAEADVASSVDLLVGYVFGRVPEDGSPGHIVGTDAARLDALGVPVLFAFAPEGSATIISAEGKERLVLGDDLLNSLSEDRRFDFSFASVLSNDPENVYIFTQKVPAAVGKLPLAPAEKVVIRTRTISDLVSSLGGATTGRKNARGRLILLSGVASHHSLISFDVIEDILLGRRLTPDLRFAMTGEQALPGGMAFSLEVTNDRSEFSELSRINNWFDVHVTGGTISDVKNADFDRYQLLDEKGAETSFHRATHVRFFETFVAPREVITGGPILVRGNPNAIRITVSSHLTLPDARVVETPEAELALPPLPG